MKDPYQIIKRRYITEKATVLQELCNKESNRSLARCKSPKYVFLVDCAANKQEIATAIEAIYSARNVKVTAVNTVNVKRKPKRRGKGRPGFTANFKKAIVTFEPGDQLDNV
jgi:large subunit ribosomal protein L23